ncbi:hypothetical protein QVD17_27228 [Tagetes erecta]|uniref:EF-hand domain-containing protein n=1 Tax=Tagetes erecta TaxID=13708 RepID=A0AAD8K831_TARER|nr:hypothetical protein QVD17_27228 [Tagetes erecta]
MKVNYDEIVQIMIRHLDIDGNGNIEKHEFKLGMEKWLVLCNLQKQSHDNNQENDTYHQGQAKAAETFKAILLIFGNIMLGGLAEPLVEKHQLKRLELQFKRDITQHPSKIYHKVLLNNIMGSSVLVSVIYFRGLRWQFSAEIVVAIICIIMALLVSLNPSFPTGLCSSFSLSIHYLWYLFTLSMMFSGLHETRSRIC